MAQEYSFDISAQVDLQAIDDVINNALKEIKNRFDFKNVKAEIIFNRGEKIVTYEAPSDFQVKQIKDIVLSKMAKRGVSGKALQEKKTENSSGGGVRIIYEVVQGIEKEMAKQIAKDIKESGIKVKTAIQNEQIRVSGPDKDDLQKTINLVKEKDYPLPLQFVNYR